MKRLEPKDFDDHNRKLMVRRSLCINICTFCGGFEILHSSKYFETCLSFSDTHCRKLMQVIIFHICTFGGGFEISHSLKRFRTFYRVFGYLFVQCSAVCDLSFNSYVLAHCWLDQDSWPIFVSHIEIKDCFGFLFLVIVYI